MAEVDQRGLSGGAVGREHRSAVDEAAREPQLLEHKHRLHILEWELEVMCECMRGPAVGLLLMELEKVITEGLFARRQRRDRARLDSSGQHGGAD